MGEYHLRCMHPDCKKTFETDTYQLSCDEDHEPALLRTIYKKKQLTTRDDLPGVFKFIDWLPCGDNYLPIDGRPIAYKSFGFAKHLGLSNLWIAFSGYWPERNAHMITRTFKQLEAPATVVRYLTTSNKPLPLIVSSAGNTANAFNYVMHELGLPLFLTVPTHGLSRLRLPFETKPFCVAVEGDYTDAIVLSDAIAKETGLFREGGAKNVARRDGMGVAMLEAVTTSGKLFDHYFQAVGSGTGGIAAWEAVLRLIEDGKYGATKTKLHLAQNKPFTPLVDSWDKKSADLVDINEEQAKLAVETVMAPVLTNRHPPYAVRGGVRDALLDTNGHMYGVSNANAIDASRLFRATEGIDVGPASSIAVGALIQAIAEGKIDKNDNILLHCTGGGLEAELRNFQKIYDTKPTMTVKPGELQKVIAEIGSIEPYQAASILKKA